MNELFRRFALQASRLLGTAHAFLLAVGLVLVWALTGPIFDWSESWQLVINTGTTIVTFLMVFLIQNTQNRDARALHIKLDELILHLKGPRNDVAFLEYMTDAELESFEKEIARLRSDAAGTGRTVDAILRHKAQAPPDDRSPR